MGPGGGDDAVYLPGTSPDLGKTEGRFVLRSIPKLPREEAFYAV